MPKNVPKSLRLSKFLKPVVVIAFFAGLGGILLLTTHAATPYVSLEPDNGTITAPAIVKTDTTASGGKAIGFAAATSTSPSGEAMPIGNLTGWKQVFTDDFTTNVALGSWPGAYAAKWDGYEDGTPDTAGGQGYNSEYRPTKVLSAQNGVMDMYLHSENGTALGAAPAPILAGQSEAWQGQLYGRYSVRARSDSLYGFKTAWLLWPLGDWPRDGEVDFPEAGLESTVGAFMHRQGATEGDDTTGYVSPIKISSGWHTYTMDWGPNKMTFYIDGAVLGTTTVRVPNTAMYYLMQTEACQGWPIINNNPCPAAATAGHLQIDWITVYSYSP